MKRLALAIIIMMAFFFSISLFIAYDFTITIAKIIMVIFACSFGLFVIMSLVFAALMLRDNWLKKQTEQSLRDTEVRMKNVEIDIRKKEGKRVVVTAPKEHQIVISDETHGDWFKPHLDARVYSNSRETYEEPTDAERQAWERFHKPQIIKGTSKLLPETTENEPEKVTTFHEVMDQYPHVLLVGGTNSGKTTLMNQAIHYRLEQYPDAEIYWLSPHSNLDHPHPLAEVSQQAKAIKKTLRRVFAEYQTRRDTGTIGNQIILALDEWPEMVDEIDGLGNILRRLSRGGRKCGFSVILASHGSSVSDLDIKGRSSVKMDFAEILLDSKRTKQGKAIWQQYNKKSSQVEIELPRRRDVARKIASQVGSKNKASKAIYGRSFGGDLAGKF